MTKPNRWDILLGILFLLCALCVLLFFLPNGDAPARAEVRVDGEVTGVYSLAEHQTVDINGHNLLVIEAGEVYMQEADCPDRYCVHHKPISKTHETIVCLPNRVVVTILGGEEAAYDGISR